MRDLSQVRCVLVDLDDTLIATSHLYVAAGERACAFIARRLGVDAATVSAYFQRTDAAQARQHGFARDRFAQSMIRTLEAFAARAGYHPSWREYDHLDHLGYAIFDQRGANLPGAEHLLARLRAAGYGRVLYSAGDPGVQQQRLAWSGLGPSFDAMRIVAHKTAPALAATIGALGLAPAQVAMLGNSPAQDIAPAVAMGCAAIWLDGASWAVDQAAISLDDCHRVTSLDAAAALLLGRGAGQRRALAVR